MSNPEIKLQVSLENPNIESNVPGEQELRDDNKMEKNNEPKEQEGRNGDENNAKEENISVLTEQKGEEAKQDINKSNAESSETDTNKELATKEDFVLTPVMTITKEEAVFTKGDLKLQKISVTEDISGSETVTVVTHEKVTLSSNGPDIKEEMVTLQRTTTQKDAEDKTELKKPKTRIPTLRFRQAVDKVRKERRSAQNRKEREISQPTPRRSSIPRLRDSKIPCGTTKDTSPQKIEKTKTSPQIEDEFDKLYDDLVDGEDCDDNLSIASKIEDPVKVESTFEEIIHAYEENKIQPINVEKVKQSKIPLLKRKSEQEIEVPKQSSTTVKQSVSLDSYSITSSSTTEKQGKIQSVTLNKSPVGKGMVSKRISETKSVQETSISSSETLKTVSVSKVKETNTQVSKVARQEVIKENINTKIESKDTNNKNITTAIKESVKISAPDFENSSIKNLNSKLDSDAQKTSIISLKTEEQNYTSNTKEFSSASKLIQNEVNVKTETKIAVNNEANQQEEIKESNKNIVKELGKEKALNKSNSSVSPAKGSETKENEVQATQSAEIRKLQELDIQKSAITTKSVSLTSKKAVENLQSENIKISTSKTFEQGESSEFTIDFNKSNSSVSAEKGSEIKENEVHATQFAETGKLQEFDKQKSAITTKAESLTSKKAVENIQSENIKISINKSFEQGESSEFTINLNKSNSSVSAEKVSETKENEVHTTKSAETGKLRELDIQKSTITSKSVSLTSKTAVKNLQSENINKTFEQVESNELTIDNSKGVVSSLSQQKDLSKKSKQELVDETHINKPQTIDFSNNKEKEDTSLNMSSEISREISKTGRFTAATVKSSEKEDRECRNQNLKHVEEKEKEDFSETNMQNLGTIKRDKTVIHATKSSDTFVNTSIFSANHTKGISSSTRHSTRSEENILSSTTNATSENIRRSRESLIKEENSVAGELPALKSKISEVLRRIDSIEAHSKLVHEKKTLKRSESTVLSNKAEKGVSSISTNTTQSSQNKQNNIITQIATTEIVEKEKAKYSKIENLDEKANNLATEEEDEEDIPIIRGKVNRMLSRITSVESAKPTKKDLDDDILKHNRIVSAKIAMFERSESVETLPKTKVRCATQIRRLKNSDSNEAKDFSTNESPKIVEEVLKAMPAQVIDENQNKSKHIYRTETTYSNDYVSYKDSSRHTFDIQIVDVQPKLPSELSTESNNASTSKVYKEKSVYNVNSTTTKKTDVDPTFINSDIVAQKIPKESKKGTNDGEYQPVYLERTVSWSRRNIAENSLNNKEYWNNSNIIKTKNESYNIQNRPKIVSDIKKQEVKYESFETSKDYTNDNTETDLNSRKIWKNGGQLRIHAYRNEESNIKTKSKSLADLYLEDTVKGKVKNIVVRMNSADRFDLGKKELIDIKERPRKRSVLEKIALFESKSTPVKIGKTDTVKEESKEVREEMSEEECAKKIEELLQAKAKYGSLDQERMPYLELRDGGRMPVIGIGTALLNPKLTRYVVQAAIDLGYRTIDTAYIYGNEKQVGEAINEKIKDGTVKREDLFIISKLWSTFHRKDLVEKTCRESLKAMGLDYFDLYLIHNPMSFKEGPDPIPKIASVIQFSEYDYLDAWYGIEDLVRKGLVKHGGVSNFNSVQIDRIVEKGKIKPAINQVECHPYLSQNRLEDFCNARNVKLCCFGVLGSKGTPLEMKSGLPPAIEDPLVRVMAAGLDISPAVLLISYQLSLGRSVVVKASSPANLWNCLHALAVVLSPGDVSALHALNRNKRTFTFQGMGETHKNYPFNIPF